MPKFRIVVSTTYTVDAVSCQEAYIELCETEDKVQYLTDIGSITIYDSNGDRCRIEAQ